ncbi:MAG: GHKL domain-containing protein [Beutenbergiaceae bacterium]
MITDLPDIPRLLTALAEWSACVVYIALMPRRFGMVRTALLVLVGLAALVGVQTLAGNLPLSLWAVGMTLAALTMYLLLLAAADTDARGAGDLLARAFVLAELVASLEWQLDRYLFSGTQWGTGRLALALGSFGVVLTIAYLVERRNFPNGRHLRVDSHMLAGALSIALVTFFMSNLSFVITDTPFSADSGPEIFYVRTLVDFAGFVALYASRSQQLQVRRTSELRAMNAVLRSQHESYLQSRHQMESVNARYHDLKQYITAMRAETDAPVRAALVDQLEASIQGYDETAVDTGNAVADTMLSSKMAAANADDITISYVVDGTLLDFMDPMPIVTIFGNALDNAIEASRRVADPDKRLIRVAVFRRDQFIMMRFENYFEGELQLRDGVPQTTKAEAQEHGYGIRNIRQAAQGYGGSVTVRREGSWFVLRLLIPVPPAHDDASEHLAGPELARAPGSAEPVPAPVPGNADPTPDRPSRDGARSRRVAGTGARPAS